MIIEAISQITTHMTTLAGDVRAQGFGDVCAAAPSPAADNFARDAVGWVKWGVIWTIIGCGFASAGAMVAGKVAQSGRAAQIGASGMFWTVIGAGAFAVIYGIISGIVGHGC